MWLTSPSILSVIRALKSLFFQGADSPLLYQTHEMCNTIKIAWLIANFLRDLGHEDVTERVLTALNKKLVKVIIKFEKNNFELHVHELWMFIKHEKMFLVCVIKGNLFHFLFFLLSYYATEVI